MPTCLSSAGQPPAARPQSFYADVLGISQVDVTDETGGHIERNGIKLLRRQCLTNCRFQARPACARPFRA